MKKCLSFILFLMFVIMMITPVFAADTADTNGTVIFYREETLDNGITVIEEIIETSQTRATGKTCTRTNTFKDGDTVIAVIAFQATFHYDGTTVIVASKSVTQTDTYDGWNYKQTSFTSSGGTVTLDARLTKWLGIFNNAFTMSLSCDKDGNISHY